MSFQELWTVMKLKGIDPRIMRNLHLEFHRRLAFPFACFVFAFIGIPLGLQNRRSGKSMGFFLCIATLLIYYVFLAIGKALGQQGTISPALSMWLPNLFFIAAGIYLFKKAASEQITPLFDVPHRLQKWAETRISVLRSGPWV
jgi:lipopolysaccharide export system permease protein